MQIDDTQEFPSLPPRKKGHHQEHPLLPQCDPLPSKMAKEQPKTPEKESRRQTPVIDTSLDTQGKVTEVVKVEAPWASQDAQATDSAPQVPESEGLTLPFSPTYFEFASDRYGQYDGLSSGLTYRNMFGQSSSFFQSKDNRNPSIDDIDNYMSHLPSMLGYGGMHELRPSSHDHLIENQRLQQAVLFFENLPDGETYLELFERCSQYGPLVLSSVDIRYVKENCHGQGKVTFSSSADSEIALRSLTDAGYNVTREISEPSIDIDLYDQLNLQHPDALDTTFVSYHQDEISPVDRWGYDSTRQLGNGHMNHGNLLDSASGQEKQAMFGMSPLPASLSPASSSTVSLPNSHDWGDRPASRYESPDQPQEEPEQSTQKKDHDEKEVIPKAPPKTLSYSDMVKVPPKPVPKPPEPKSPLQSDAEDYDMKRRGNTNKSLDKNEYRLNLYLKNLESSMDDCQLYTVCVQFGEVMSCRVITNNRGECTGLGFVMYLRNSSVTDALKGLKELGYQAEIAVPSATNKLRCKEMSDTLFLQNIPEAITENKLRDLFKPFTVMNCHILKDPRTGKGRGVAFLKMRDIHVAERFIETFHGRVLGPYWRLPLQVSPARRNNHTSNNN
ncbi:Protein phosphatase PP2A regulatory subunit B [Podila clonocystis]|nr:Protein phosphatase PP2A regulatory subunit B [Podila clonocystis]